MPAGELNLESGDWPQAVIEFADRRTAERVAAGHLLPELLAAEVDGAIARWFFIRKSPCWRLRYQPADGRASAHIARVLDALEIGGQIVRWTSGIYEPEVLAFGGLEAMNVAHDLFHQDSRSILGHLARPDRQGPGRCELTVLLCSVLLRGAGLDWYEQGDVWARVAQHRLTEHAALAVDRPGELRHAMHRLMTADASPTAALAAWSPAFERAGQRLADLARRGALERGLRAVLSHHVIFHMNRLGLSYAEQRILATLATEVVMAEQGGVTTPSRRPT